MGDLREQLKTYTSTCLKHLPTQTHLWKWNAYPGSTKPQSALKNILQCKKNNKTKGKTFGWCSQNLRRLLGPKSIGPERGKGRGRPPGLPADPCWKREKEFTHCTLCMLPWEMSMCVLRDLYLTGSHACSSCGCGVSTHRAPVHSHSLTFQPKRERETLGSHWWWIKNNKILSKRLIVHISKMNKRPIV